MIRHILTNIVLCKNPKLKTYHNIESDHLLRFGAWSLEEDLVQYSCRLYLYSALIPEIVVACFYIFVNCVSFD